MVKQCNTKYENYSSKYKKIFNTYSFELDHFQKYAIEAIEEKKHILITAHTGSGKTLPAEYAIQKFCDLGKKVIYTSPIKSLSNQKFHEFSMKFPNISFGIMTGDIKFNPDADCLIMTTEILRNTLFQNELYQNTNNIKEQQAIKETLNFNIDIENELECVIFDEIHYINDPDRGKVWEETIMKLPYHIQMVMLSATIDKKEEFAHWIETVKEREVWIASTDVRVVPLEHYSYYITNNHVLKNIKDKKIEKLMNETNNELRLLNSTQQKSLNNNTIIDLNKLYSFMFKHHVRITPKEVLNKIIKKLYDNQMLPAICFVFSRKNVELFAKHIEITLFEEEENNIISIIERECKSVIKKLPNYKEYFELPEFNNMVKLLEKGIAIHHSGVMPVLREMVEILFSKGYIKLLFATETFSVGINMPTKTVLFTSLLKFDGSGMRYLLSHEYTQMAGRAGRRGLDKIGYVIHLNNMFEAPTLYEYKEIISGKPQTLTSKFYTNSNLVLKMIACSETNTNNLIKFTSNSFYNNELETFISTIQKKIDVLNNNLKKYENTIQLLTTPYSELEKYDGLEFKLDYSKQKQKKKIERMMTHIKESYKSFQNDYKTYCFVKDIQNEINNLEKEKANYMLYQPNEIKFELDNLEKNGFIGFNENSYSLSFKGKIASQIQEINGLVISELIERDLFNQFEANDLCALFSCFTNIRVNDEVKTYFNKNLIQDNSLLYTYKIIIDRLNYYYNIELKKKYVKEDEYNMIFDLVYPMYEWCNAKNEKECKLVIQTLYEKGIFLGEFIKVILKINNISEELKKVCILIGNIKLQQQLSKIPDLTLKYVATNQSLYI